MGVVSLPFDASASGFSRANALYLAHAADIAYLRSPSRAAAERLGLSAIPFRHRITRARGFLGVCDTHAVLSFRGTNPSTLANWLTDSVVKLVRRPDYAGRVHHGFASVLKRTWPQIEPLFRQLDGRPLFLTGHSMGGALAVLTGCRMANLGRAPMATYTFGAPRVGDPDFCARYSLPTYRVVNRLDLVPEMPMASVSRLLPARPRLTNDKTLARLKRLADRVPCYAHVDTFVYIDRDGAIVEGADVEPWHAHTVAHALATRGKSFLEGVTDHLLSNYIRGLEATPTTPPPGRLRRRIRVE